MPRLALRLSPLALGVAALLALAPSPAPLPAQVAAPYGTIALRVGSLANVNRERLHESWRPIGGVELQLATPLPLGEAALVVGRVPFRSRRDDVPDFDATLLALRWGLARQVAGPLGARATILLGDFLMRFDDGERSVHGLTEESELFAGLAAGVDLRLTRWLAASAEVAHQRVLTHLPIDLTTVSLGARATAPSPGWLRRVLE